MTVGYDIARAGMGDRKVTVELTWDQIGLLQSAIRVAQATGDMAEYWAELRTIDTEISCATIDLMVEASRRAA